MTMAAYGDIVLKLIAGQAVVAAGPTREQPVVSTRGQSVVAEGLLRGNQGGSTGYSRHSGPPNHAVKAQTVVTVGSKSKQQAVAGDQTGPTVAYSLGFQDPSESFLVRKV